MSVTTNGFNGTFLICLIINISLLAFTYPTDQSPSRRKGFEEVQIPVPWGQIAGKLGYEVMTLNASVVFLNI